VDDDGRRLRLRVIPEKGIRVSPRPTLLAAIMLALFVRAESGDSRASVRIELLVVIAIIAAPKTDFSIWYPSVPDPIPYIQGVLLNNRSIRCTIRISRQYD
jgi:hypothetical protein